MMKKINITIKGLLVVWVLIAVTTVLILVLTSLDSYQSVSKNQQIVTDKAKPLQVANNEIKSAVTGVIGRQLRVISTDSSEKLAGLKDRDALESRFTSAMRNARQAAGDDSSVIEPLTALEEAYKVFLSADTVLFEKKRTLLQINNEQKDYAEKMDSSIQNIQKVAEGIAGKINFSNKRAKRRIRKLYKKIQDLQDIEDVEESEAKIAFQFRDQVGEQLLSRSADLQQVSAGIRTGVAVMGSLGRQFMLESSPDILTSIKENQLTQLIQSTKASISKIDEGSRDDPELNTQIKRLNSDFQQLVNTLINEENSILTSRRKGLKVTAEMQSASTDVQSATASMEQAINVVVQAVDKIQAGVDEQGHRVISDSRTILLITASVALVVIIFISFIVLRRVNRPLAMATKAMRDFAQGNISNRMNYKGRDEFAALAHDFNALAENICGLIEDIHRSSNELSSGAENLSSISTQTNLGIERQQSETTQVATAMNEMAATAQEMAKNANHAEQAAQQANAEAVKGHVVVSEAVSATNDLASEVQNVSTAIHKLEDESDSISTVLDVIRSIAEQTNLLALNAAIEAARAGEQGRGFAVVADEVRTLAGRTQDSTQEIQQIIERVQQGAKAAVDAMEKGREKATNSVEKVEKAGETLGEIIQAVGQIKEMNVQIATAVEQQGAVVEEINQNVVSINALASQTADGAKLTATASMEQAGLAANLKKMAAKFST
ncbi:hypothetical protein DJ030_09760 [bacterium endosymbiont of Escarpia laminata]|nr:MAG: hypothetical protein DJ030_09760 [bacterium endosymbiont of Escarpia laminata]